MEKQIGIKFKPIGKIYYFETPKEELNDGEGVIVETSRGIEYGEIAFSNKPTVFNAEEDFVVKSFIRRAVDKDYVILEKNNEKALEYGKLAKKLITNLGLEMKLIDAELTFDTSKVIFTFTAEGRVDFRELVKELANTLKIRIELKQVGARDEAKIIGGLGPCGRTVCCSNHMREFNKVSIKMAKTQGLALNPTKINGLCNRLMCCLSYEDDYYSEVIKQMPKIGKTVITPNGEGVVVYNNLLKKLVTVRFICEDGSSELKEFNNQEVQKVRQQEENETDITCTILEKNNEVSNEKFMEE